MAPDYDHKQWMANQLVQGHPRKRYRDVILFTSFIESTVSKEAIALGKQPTTNKKRKRNKKPMMQFKPAIELLKSQLDPDEYKRFHRIRYRRNKLIHGILERELTGTEIDRCLKKLQVDLMWAYENSQFVQKNLISPYRAHDREKTEQSEEHELPGG